MKKVNLIFAIFAIIFAVRLLFFFIPKKRTKNHSIAKSYFYYLMFIVSAVAMVLNIIIILEYQLIFGAIFIKFGLISSLFMIGLFLGGMTIRQIIRKKYHFNLAHAIFIFLLYCIALLFISYIKNEILFILLFIGAGFSSGMFLPLIAHYFDRLNINSVKYSMKLEILDHFGGAIGSIVASILLIPLLGIEKVLYLIIILLTMEILLFLIYKKQSTPTS